MTQKLVPILRTTTRPSSEPQEFRAWMFSTLGTLLTSLLPMRRVKPGHRTQPQCHHSRDANFRRMVLVGMTYQCDFNGRWWRIETRQDLFTGVVIRRTERITD